jgi:hypothetical protein
MSCTAVAACAGPKKEAANARATVAPRMFLFNMMFCPNLMNVYNSAMQKRISVCTHVARQVVFRLHHGMPTVYGQPSQSFANL